MIQKIWNWLVYSSTNADAISATVKSTIATIVAIVANVIIFGHLKLNPADIQLGGDSIVALVQGGLGLITALITFVSIVSACIAFIRKIYLSLIGKNAVLNIQ